MSYDLAILFRQAEFPRVAWRDILSSFEGEECFVRFDIEREDELPSSSCDLIVEDSVLSVGLGPVQPGGRAEMWKGAKWEAVLSTTMGRSFRALWIQFAIPYYTLMLVPEVAVHAEPDRIFTDPENWLEFCRKRLWNPLRQKEAAVEAGLFMSDGSPRF